MQSSAGVSLSQDSKNTALQREAKEPQRKSANTLRVLDKKKITELDDYQKEA